LVVHVTVDESSIAWIDELATRLSSLDLAKSPVKIVELVRRIFQRAPAFNLKRLPAGLADECRVVLYPSDAMLSLMAALRTFDRGCDLIDETGHIIPSA
jgi:hypothetical protein